MDIPKPATTPFPPQIKEILYRTSDLLLRFLRRLLPCFAIPTYCPDCRAKSRLRREEVLHWGEDYWVQGIRFWQCPHCGQRSEEHYTYIKYVDTH